MRKYIIPFNLILLVLLVFSPLYAYADSPKKTPAPQQINTAEYRVGDNMVVHATGRTWTDAHGQQVYEYKARIDSAPSYANGDGIDTTWHSKSAKKWEAGNNVFTARVIGDMVCVTYNNRDMLWSPQVYIGGVEYKAADAVLIGADTQNGNYQNNILSWDYGVCERRLRLIEGEIIETYIFKSNPGADIQIKSNTIKDSDFIYDAPVWAIDANNNPITISADKTIKAEDLKAAAFPITVDPTDSFTTSASDAYTEINNAVYATAWAAGSCTTVYSSASLIQIGQYWGMGTGYHINRAGVYFDTSSLPDAGAVTAATLYLYGLSDSSVVDFNISIQSGLPTYPQYPHDPFVAGDYYKDVYSGIGGSLSTASFSASGYNAITLNATGISWISLTGDTKFMLRSSRDISGTAPAGSGTSPEYVDVYSYEQGAGYQPYLEVTYVAGFAPTLTTSAASYVAKTTARINGLVTADGGEAASVNFNYLPWYSAGWQDCIEFTIDADYVDADLTNFPVLITGAQLNTTDADFWTSVNSSGSDILFTNSNKVKLNRELVSINTTAKTMECYVNVTSIDDTTDTKIYMYYNSANISLYNESNSTSTWDSDYLIVYHMNDNPNTSTVQDSTVNNNDGIKVGAATPYETTGYFSGDKAQYYDGSGKYIVSTANLTSNTNFTTEALFLRAGNSAGFSDSTRHALLGNVLGVAHTCVISAGTSTSSEVYDTAWRWSPTTSITAANWHFVGSRLTTNSSWYTIADGALSSATSIIGVSSAAISKLYVGRLATVNYLYSNGSISEVRVSNISRSSAWINASYYSMMQNTLFAPVTDVFSSTSTQSKATGESFYSDLTGLTGGTLYGYKTEGTNSYGTAWGAWVTFTTAATCQGPGNLSAYPNATAVELVWQKGSGASGTMIRYKEGSYPSSTTDGDLAYNGSGTSCIQNGMDPGTSYYYRAWADDGSGTYSANYSSALTTTFAGDSSAADTPDAPTAPNGWFQAPDYTRMANFPLYGLFNAGFDAGSIPRDSGWMALAVIASVLAGVAAYFFTKRSAVIACGVVAVSLALSATMGLLSWWYVGIFLIAAIALNYKVVTR